MSRWLPPYAVRWHAQMTQGNTGKHAFSDDLLPLQIYESGPPSTSPHRKAGTPCHSASSPDCTAAAAELPLHSAALSSSTSSPPGPPPPTALLRPLKPPHPHSSRGRVPASTPTALPTPTPTPALAPAPGGLAGVGAAAALPPSPSLCPPQPISQLPGLPPRPPSLSTHPPAESCVPHHHPTASATTTTTSTSTCPSAALPSAEGVRAAATPYPPYNVPLTVVRPELYGSWCGMAFRELLEQMARDPLDSIHVSLALSSAGLARERPMGLHRPVSAADPACPLEAVWERCGEL